jgi:primary-amine oxidase
MIDTLITSKVTHPLQPLTQTELGIVVSTLRAEKSIGDTVRFISVSLKEPSKQQVKDFRMDPQSEITRDAFVVLFDNATN